MAICKPISENPREIEFTLELFPECKSYLDVYDSNLAQAVWPLLEDSDFQPAICSHGFQQQYLLHVKRAIRGHGLKQAWQFLTSTGPHHQHLGGPLASCRPLRLLQRACFCERNNSDLPARRRSKLSESTSESAGAYCRP